ncbi:pyocin knob domain-containing protein [Methylobacterium sp. AMS5]|uniref:pyocin knob domain-containing protein n=1 Tax=Methylobacterium sp. AMS5 TaxID=925818 RepID=UPI00074F9F76|nr:pyocin knob domain-containing protein [Methylobacterium sp. AMS5]AMB48244.1 hypothetical protein Y590_25080 [Methylobacterium sp. AMS5]
MAYRKASEENPVVALGSEDFWAAVQNGGDVRISVGDILVWLRTVLQIEDVNELQAALDAIGATAHQELQDALGTLGGSVSDSLDALQADVDTRATKQELTTALGGLDGSVKTKLDTLTADVAAKDAKVRTDFAAADAKVKADLQAVINGLGTASARNAGNAAGQLPVLGADGKLDASTIPAVAITDTFPVATQAAMLASGAERGDIAIRTDLNRCYILQVEPATTLANWKELLTPTDAVLSVAGLTGAITAAGLKAALGIAIGDVAGLQAALDGLRADVNAALSTKFDKSGGTVSGDVTATGMLRSDRLTYTRATSLATGTDLNTIKVAGFYDGSALVNAPDATSWWYVEVQRHTSDNGHVQQRATRLNGSPEVYVRNQSSATWQPWYRVWTSLNFNPDTKASLNASVSFSALTVSARPTWAGLTPWDTGNFDPNTKATVNTEVAFSTVQAGIFYIPAAGLNGGRVAFDTTGTSLRIYEAASPFRGVALDFAGAGSQSSLWHSGNFNPATKANVAGQAFTGSITAPGVAVPRTAAAGGLSVVAGGASNTGYIEFWPAGTGVRHGYIGFSNGSTINIAAEVGRFNFTGNEPFIAGNQIWHAGSFNPDTKANVAGQAFTGTISAPQFTLPGTGNNWFAIGNGDNATYATTNTRLRTHWGLGMESYDGTVNGFYDSRAGVWDTKGVPRVNGQNVWYPGNFNPATKANLTGADFSGSVSSTGRLIAGVGQTNSYIEMRDTDEGTRYIHNNGGNIGFLNSSAGWAMRVNDAGALWTAQLGDLSTRIEDRSAAWARQESVARANERVAKTGDTMTGDLTVSKAYPTYRFFYSGVRDMGWQLREDACMYLWDWSGNTWQMRVDTSGAIIARGSIYTGNGSASLATNGDIWGSAWGNRWLSVAMGDITNNANGRVARTGDTMSGDLRLQTGDPRIKIDRSGVGGFSFLIHSDNRLYIQKEAGWAFQNNVASFGADGSIWTNQLGDLNTRIEDRAYAWAADRASYRVAKTGDTMTGDLTIAREWPTLTLLWGGVYRWALRTANSAEFQVMNPDTDSIKFAVRPNGSLYSAQMGDVEQFIRAVVNNKSIRLAYAGDLSNDWNKDQSYAEPYGGGVLTSRYVVSNQFIVDSWKGGRWRYLQMSDAWGNWYTCGYV